LIFGYLSLLIPAVFCSFILSNIDETSGNGGAFMAALAFGIGFTGLMLTTFFGIVSLCIVSVFSDKLPSSKLYSRYWPAIIAALGPLAVITWLIASAL
jgi:hypothetical protein